MLEVLAPSFKIIVGEAEIVVVLTSAKPGVTVKLLLVPNSDPVERVAVMVQVPMLVILTVCWASTPLVKLAVVPWPSPMLQFDVTETVPVKAVIVVPVPSTARMTISKVCPAYFELILPLGYRSTTNPVMVPVFTMLKLALVSAFNPALLAAKV